MVKLSRMGVVVVIAALVVAACGSGSDSAQDTAVSGAVAEAAVTTSAVTATSVAVAVTSTTAATTTTSQVSTTTVPAEVLVADVHRRVFTELIAVDERIEGPEGVLQLAEELTTGVLLERLRALAANNLASGERIVGGYESNIVEVVVTGDSASVLDCSRDAAELYSASGELLVPADDYFKLRESRLVRIDGAWLVKDIYTGGDYRCDPADLQ